MPHSESSFAEPPLLVTGGAGFIGSNFVLHHFQDTAATHAAAPIVNLDALTYAANPGNLASLDGNPRHHLVQGNIPGNMR